MNPPPNAANIKLSPLFKKFMQRGLKKKLRDFEKDPGMRDAIKRLNRSIDDFERELEISAELMTQDSDGKGKFKSKKNLYKHLKDLGFKWRDHK